MSLREFLARIGVFFFIVMAAVPLYMFVSWSSEWWMLRLEIVSMVCAFGLSSLVMVIGDV